MSSLAWIMYTYLGRSADHLAHWPRSRGTDPTKFVARVHSMAGHVWDWLSPQLHVDTP